MFSSSDECEPYCGVDGLPNACVLAVEAWPKAVVTSSPEAEAPGLDGALDGKPVVAGAAGVDGVEAGAW
nr:hypothetical protein [Tsukamurella tyrosinosolvens]KZL96825.1 hypothetical protein AXX05_15120 [Tsukamurella tyrosinosolvens]